MDNSAADKEQTENIQFANLLRSAVPFSKDGTAERIFVQIWVSKKITTVLWHRILDVD